MSFQTHLAAAHILVQKQTTFSNRKLEILYQGVPRGTVLGPIVLILNDFHLVLNNQNRAIQFADYSSLIANRKSSKAIAGKIDR